MKHRPATQKRRGGPGKFTTNPEAIRRCLQLRGEGKGSRAIAESLKAERLCDVSHQTIAEYLAKLEEAETKRAAPPTNAKTYSEALADLPEGAPIEVVRSRVALLTKMIGRLEKAVEDESYSPVAWASLVRLEVELAGRLVALEPAKPVDPNDDPYHRESSDRFVKKMERTIANMEASARCQHCGKPPYREVA